MVNKEALDKNEHKTFWLLLGTYLEVSWNPFFTFSLCGLFGILPDIDHIIQIGDLPREASSRFLHLPVLIIILTSIIWMLTYLIRLLWKSFLINRGK